MAPNSIGSVRTVDLRQLTDPPFDLVLDALEGVSSHETIEIIVSSEPLGLYDAIDNRDWNHKSRKISQHAWRVLITTPDHHEGSDSARKSSSIGRREKRAENTPVRNYP